MADDIENDDQWLYGDTPDVPRLDDDNNKDTDEYEESLLAPPGASPERKSPPPETEEPENEAELETNTDEREPASEQMNTSLTSHQDAQDEVEDPGPPGVDDEEMPERPERSESADKQNGDGTDHDDSEDDSDDDVNVVIGDIKTSPAYSSLNIKRGNLLSTTTVDKSKQAQAQSGKFTVEEFDQIGYINGIPATDYSLDALEDKPWRKPGADITDYFNYGFNEDTWKAYCERQKRIRVNESGVGLIPLNAIGLPRGPMPIMNDNSKYSGIIAGARKAGPPPGRRMTGAIDVIGGAAQPGLRLDTPKENIIQVMTADRREYSRKPPGFPDLTMPPPSTFEEFQPAFDFNPEPEPFYGGYEPTADLQWGTSNPTWVPTEIKSLTPGPVVPPTVPPVNLPPPMVPPVHPHKESTPPPPPAARSRDSRERERDRETSRSRSEKPRDRERERSHRRERSRSRSHRHKSRSRSPSHRHRKKKSRRHDDSD